MKIPSFEVPKVIIDVKKRKNKGKQRSRIIKKLSASRDGGDDDAKAAVLRYEPSSAVKRARQKRARQS